MALKHKFTAVTMAQTFFDNVFMLHGMLASIVSNGGSIFLSHFWKELFNLRGVSLAYSSSYHPQSDGQIDIVNKCLK